MCLQSWRDRRRVALLWRYHGACFGAGSGRQPGRKPHRKHCIVWYCCWHYVQIVSFLQNIFTLQIFLIRQCNQRKMFCFCFFLERGCNLILSKHGPFTAFIPMDTSQVSPCVYAFDNLYIQQVLHTTTQFLGHKILTIPPSLTTCPVIPIMTITRNGSTNYSQQSTLHCITINSSTVNRMIGIVLI